MEGKRIKERLVDAGVTQKRLAELLEVTPQSVNAILSASDVRSGTIEKLSGVLGVPVSYFYGSEPAQSVKVGEAATIDAPIVANNHQERSSLGGSYNSPELVQALVGQLAAKDSQLERKDTQLAEKDSQLERKDSQIASLLAQVAALADKIAQP